MEQGGRGVAGGGGAGRLGRSPGAEGAGDGGGLRRPAVASSWYCPRAAPPSDHPGAHGGLGHPEDL